MVKEYESGSKFKYVMHKIGVMFKNIWKLIKKLFNKIINYLKANKTVALYSIVGILVIIIFIIATIIIGGDDSVVKKYAKGLVDENANKIYSTINSNYVKSIEDTSNVVVLDDIKKMVSSFESSKTDYLNYRIVDSYELTEDEFNDLKDDMTIYAPKYDTKKVKSAKRYLVKYKMKKNDKTIYNYSSIYIIKTGFTWSVVYNI